MLLTSACSLYAALADTPGGASSWYKGVHLIGFRDVETKKIQAVLDGIPKANLKVLKTILSDSGLKPKHGRYFPSIKLALLNPGVFDDKLKYGKGPKQVGQGQLALTHEFGHGVYSAYPERLRVVWRGLSGWQDGDKETATHKAPYEERRSGWPRLRSNKVHLRDAKFVRTYSEKNDDEDFADSYAFYVLGLRKQMPKEKLAFMQKYVGKTSHE